MLIYSIVITIVYYYNFLRDQFVKQLEVIVEGIKGSLSKISNKKTNLKLRSDELNDQFNQLIEKKRVYYKTLKDFQEVRI